jgi:hypothetical protein
MLLYIIILFMKMNPINEEVHRIKEVMGLVKESVDLPITISGSYQAPKGDGDALHSFDRRKSDFFGGYMLTGGPIPAKYSSKVKLNQGKGANQVMAELIKKGIKPDVTDINIQVNSDYTVKWSITIDKSKDGKAYAGIASRGSAGGGADSRALNQLPALKSDNPDCCNWDLVLDFNITKPIKIRQYFLKYTKCEKGEKNNDIVINQDDVEDDVKTNNVKSEKFKSWESGEYKLPKDKMWIYRLNKDKDWEAKIEKDGGDYILLRTALSSDNYNKAIEILKDAKKI